MHATNVGEKNQKLRKESHILLVLEEATLSTGSAWRLPGTLSACYIAEAAQVVQSHVLTSFTSKLLPPPPELGNTETGKGLVTGTVL